MSKITYQASGATIYRDAKWHASTQCETGCASSAAECATAAEIARILDSHADLLAACKALLGHLDGLAEPDCSLARAAIAKAGSAGE